MDDLQQGAWTQHRVQCEAGVLSGAMTNPSALPELAAVINQSDFTDPFLGTWFQIACELQDAGKFTIERLRAELRRVGYFTNVSDVEQFAALTNGLVDTNTHWYAHELARISSLRRLCRLLESKSIEASMFDADPVQIAAAIEAQLASVHQAQAADWEHAYDVASRVYQKHLANVEKAEKGEPETLGFSTGFSDIDEITGGLFPGQLWQIAARSGIGKTTVALAISQRQIDQNRGVYFASYEMENDELLERLLSDRTGTPFEKFNKGGLTRQDLENINVAIKDFEGRGLLLDGHPPGVGGLRARLKLAMHRVPISLVVVDHILLMPYPDKKIPRYQQVVDLTKDLKALAKELGVTILALNQLNIDADGVEPTEKHYAESKNVTQNLDVSILLHREDKTAPEMLCKVVKVRKGKASQCHLHFDGVIQRVESWLGSTWRG
jgi:replicative DNA helicase